MEGGCALMEREGWGVVIQVAGSLHDGSLDGFHNGGSLNLGLMIWYGSLKRPTIFCMIDN